MFADAQVLPDRGRVYCREGVAPNVLNLTVDGGYSFTMCGYTWQFLLVTLAGFINRQQQDVIAYLMEENRVLREKLGRKRLLLNVEQKRRLATAAIKIGRDALKNCAFLFSPETLLKWHRTLVARKYDGSGKRGPKVKKANEVRKLVLRFKQENADWGYPRPSARTLRPFAYRDTDASHDFVCPDAQEWLTI